MKITNSKYIFWVHLPVLVQNPEYEYKYNVLSKSTWFSNLLNKSTSRSSNPWVLVQKNVLVTSMDSSTISLLYSTISMSCRCPRRLTIYLLYEIAFWHREKIPEAVEELNWQLLVAVVVAWSFNTFHLWKVSLII